MIGLVLTSLMILIFLGSMRATFAVLLSIPISALATFVVLYMLGSTVNTMILGGLALAFSRVIDNSVISLENIYRHLEMGSSPAVAAEEGGAEVNLAVLAATLVDVVDFFPVTFLFGVSKFLFSALALAFCLSLLASFVVAMTVIPLFCSKFLKGVHHEHDAEARNEPLPGRAVQCLVQSHVQPLAGRLRARGAACAEASGTDAGGAAGRVRRQPGHLSVARPGVLPADRRRTIHPQHQGAHRNANRSHGPVRGQDRGSDPACRGSARSEDDRFQHRRGQRFSRSTPPTPDNTPPPSRLR